MQRLEFVQTMLKEFSVQGAMCSDFQDSSMYHFVAIVTVTEQPGHCQPSLISNGKFSAKQMGNFPLAKGKLRNSTASAESMSL